jgi:hypothetical protein
VGVDAPAPPFGVAQTERTQVFRDRGPGFIRAPDRPFRVFGGNIDHCGGVVVVRVATGVAWCHRVLAERQAVGPSSGPEVARALDCRLAPQSRADVSDAHSG